MEQIKKIVRELMTQVVQTPGQHYLIKLLGCDYTIVISQLNLRGERTLYLEGITSKDHNW